MGKQGLARLANGTVPACDVDRLNLSVPPKLSEEDDSRARSLHKSDQTPEVFESPTRALKRSANGIVA